MSSTTIAITAEIRPGKRDALIRLLDQGPPFSLDEFGLRGHQAFVGDRSVVFVFEGDEHRPDLHRLAAKLPLRSLTAMGTLVGSAQVLADAYDWHPAVVGAAS